MSRVPKRKRAAPEPSLTVGKYRLRRGTRDVDRAVKRRAENEQFFTLDYQEFTNRKRFVDLDGNTYAPPVPSDSLYKRYVRTHQIAPLDDVGLPERAGSVAVGRSRGVYRGRALLFMRKKRGRKLVRVPRGELQLLDTETLRYYTARVEIAMFRRESKSGHVVLSDLTEFGVIRSPSKFSRRA